MLVILFGSCSLKCISETSEKKKLDKFFLSRILFLHDISLGKLLEHINQPLPVVNNGAFWWKQHSRNCFQEQPGKQDFQNEKKGLF
jgi:hypothetical protein